MEKNFWELIYNSENMAESMASLILLSLLICLNKKYDNKEMQV